MTKAQKIRNEITLLGNKIEHLRQSLKELQRDCQHEYKENAYYQKCKKCLKAEVLYY